MEKTVSDLADTVKKLHDDLAVDRGEDREVISTLKQLLKENTTTMKEVSSWKAGVESKMDDLQVCVKKLNNKVEHISIRLDEADNPAYKVFQSEHLEFSEPAAAHLAASSFQAASGPDGLGDQHIHQGSGQGRT
ncbi:unnamed protein product [Urochloa humidicola]